MPKKYRRLRKTENIIVFPGTFEKLVKQGTDCVELEEFEKAVEAFDQAIVYEPDYPEFLGSYAVALYETKDFVRAKEVAANLLQSGTTNYVDAMELYLTICIQLQEYDEVEMTIETLMDEELIPPELFTKFNYLRELNGRLSERYTSDKLPPAESLFTFDTFIEMDILMQQQSLASLEGTDLRQMTMVLEDIAESTHLSPLVVTFALTLLHQANYKTELTVRKFGLEAVVIPALMTLPGQDDQTQKVLEVLEHRLLQDPSRFEMGQGLIQKFAITAFPFGWGSYHADEVAEAYLLYIESLFSGVELPNTQLFSLIKKLDNDFDLE